MSALKVVRKGTLMKRRQKLGACLLPSLLLATVATAQTYKITDLGTLSGFSASVAFDNNKSGQITGCSDNSLLPTLPCMTNIPAEASLWSISEGLRPLGYLSGDNSIVAYVVNDSGVVVGYSANTATGAVRGFVWTKGNGMVQVPDLPGGSGYTFATAITSKAVIVGESAVSNGDEHVVLWTKSAGKYHIHDEGHLPKAPYVYANDINESLQVTGVAYFFNNNSKYHAFLWSKGIWKDLGGLAPGANSIGEWLNNSGVVAGSSTSKKYPNGVSVYWDAAGKIQSIGTLQGGTSSSAGYISDSEQITGESTVTGGDTHAYLWTNKQRMQDLNNMIPKNSGWVLRHAAAINKAGQIVGYGEINGVEHGFLLKP
jgi:probable HAF family extracellular repeat protein